MAEEEPVAFHEPFELDGDDAREGGTNEAVMISGLLRETPTESVNLINVGVN